MISKKNKKFFANAPRNFDRVPSGPTPPHAASRRPPARSASPPALELEHRARRPSALGHLGHGMRAGARARAPGRRRALEHQGDGVRSSTRATGLWVIWVMACRLPKLPKGMRAWAWERVAFGSFGHFCHRKKVDEPLHCAPLQLTAVRLYSI